MMEPFSICSYCTGFHLAYPCPETPTLLPKGLSNLLAYLEWTNLVPPPAFSQHKELALLFLEYTLSILHKEAVIINSSEKGESTSESSADDCILLATMFALNAFMGGGGKIGKQAVEQSYPSVLPGFILKFGSLHGLAEFCRNELLRSLLIVFQSFCECVGDVEMGKLSVYMTYHGDQI